METATQILWREAGEPYEYVDDIQGVPEGTRCATCGGRIAEGVALADTFTGNEDGWPYFAQPTSEWVCVGCDFVSKGRWKDQFRLWSILWCEDGGLPDHHETVYEHIDAAGYGVRLEEVVEHADDRVQIMNRGALGGLLDLLLDPPDCRWFASIAESGKKKITRFSQVTSGDPYAVQFEYQTIRCSSLEFAETLWHVACMRKLGVSEERIKSGRLDPSYDREHARRLQFHNDQLSEVRGHPRFELACFCTTKEYVDECGRRAGRVLVRRGSTRSWRPPTFGDAQEREHRRHRAERLVASREGGPGDGGGDGRQLGPDDEQDGPETRDRCTDHPDIEGTQIDLF